MASMSKVTRSATLLCLPDRPDLGADIDRHIACLAD